MRATEPKRCHVDTASQLTFSSHIQGSRRYCLKVFSDRADLLIHAYAVGSQDGMFELSDQGNASCVFETDGGTVRGVVRQVSSVFAELDLTEVAAMKINIEGGEYELLPALQNAELMTRIKQLTVQFHRYFEDQVSQRDAILNRLEETHVCEWSYPFIWEKWVEKA